MKRSPSILFKMLRQKLSHALKDQNERQFIYHRLCLLDQHYCLEVKLKLQQSYLDTGLQQHRWSIRVFLSHKWHAHFTLSLENVGSTLYDVKNNGFRLVPIVSSGLYCAPGKTIEWMSTRIDRTSWIVCNPTNIIGSNWSWSTGIRW